MAAHYEGQRKTLDSLQKAAASLAETLDRKLPVLQSAGTTRLRDTGLVGVITGRVCLLPRPRFEAGHFEILKHKP